MSARPVPRSAVHCRADSEVRSLPSNCSRSAVTSSGRRNKPMMARAVSDFPDPDSPTNATRSVPTSKEMPSTNARPPVPAAVRTASFSTESIGVSATMRISQVAEPIGQQIETKTTNQHRRAGRSRHPPLVEDHLTTLGDHGAPLSSRGTHAEPQKPQAGGGQHDGGKIQGEADLYSRKTKRQHVTPQQTRPRNTL